MKASSATRERWDYPRAYSGRMLLALAAAVLLLALTGPRVDLGRLFAATPGSGGIGTLVGRFFPPHLSETRPIESIQDFDRAQLPPFAHLEQRRVVEERIDRESLALVRTISMREVLVEPLGYVARVAVKIVETFEIALWGTMLAVLGGLPLALLSARTTTPHRLIAGIARMIVGVLRAIPELVSALLLVAVYGFGPIAGVLALGIHAAGFLGKFFADDIENADRKPQDAFAAIGASRLAIWRLAVLPQVLPGYIGYALYILDRNLRMATVIGLVGAGGIGQELKGRFDMYEYSRVGTILIAIFLVVIALDALSGLVRRRLTGVE